MTSDVHLELTGIIGLVPHVGDCIALVPDALNHHKHQHLPFVLVLNEGEFEIEREDQKDTGELPWGFLLRDHEIEFGASTSSRLDTKQRWILDLEEGCPTAKPGCGRVRRRLLDEAFPKGLVGRCKLTRGELAASFVDNEHEWHFINPREGDRRLAQAVRNKFSIAGDRFEMSLKGSSSTVRLRIKARAARPNPRIDIIVANVPWPAHHAGHGATAGAGQELDEHAMIHYDLGLHTVPWAQRRPLEKVASPYPGPLPGHGDDTIWSVGIPGIPGNRKAQVDFLVDIMTPHGANCPPGLWANEPL